MTETTDRDAYVELAAKFLGLQEAACRLLGVNSKEELQDLLAWCSSCSTSIFQADITDTQKLVSMLLDTWEGGDGPSL